MGTPARMNLRDPAARSVFLVSVLLVAACQRSPRREPPADAGSGSSSSAPGGASSGQTSGGSGGSSGAPVLLDDFCQAMADAVCFTRPCDTGEGYDEQRCRASTGGAGCAAQMSFARDEIATGRLRFDEEAAGRCVSITGAYARALAAARCSPDPAAVYSVWVPFTHISCGNGIPSGAFLQDDCSRMYVGLVPPGGSCADHTVCAWEAPAIEGRCVNVTDGGCGTCAPAVLGPGERCRFPGSPRFLDCQPGYGCGDSDTCVPYRVEGEPCGGFVGMCARECGLACVADGGFSCQAFHSAPVGGACNYHSAPSEWKTCARGASCVLQSTGGVPDFSADGTCRPLAAEGEPCSWGVIYDVYNSALPDQSGASAFGSFPVCAEGLGCAEAGDYGPGTCRPYGHASPDGGCSAVVTCDPAHQCSWQSRRCEPKPTSGAFCGQDQDCAARAYCDGGACTLRKAARRVSAHPSACHTPRVSAVPARPSSARVLRSPPVAEDAGPHLIRLSATTRPGAGAGRVVAAPSQPPPLPADCVAEDDAGLITRGAGPAHRHTVDPQPTSAVCQEISGRGFCWPPLGRGTPCFRSTRPLLRARRR